jgi:hypothetical protein
MALYIGQGDVLVGKRNATTGGIDSLRNVGEAPVFEVNITTDKVTDHETSSGLRRQNLSVITKQEAEVTVTFKEPTPENLAFLCYGTEHAIGAQTLTNEAMPTGLVAGVTYRLPKDVAGVSSLVLRDSQGTPHVLVEGTDYEADVTFGTVVFTDTISTLTPPIKVSCVSSDESAVTFMDALPEDVTLILHGINTADEFAPEIWELYRVRINPPDKLPGKGDQPAEFTIKGSVLVDPKKPKPTPTNPNPFGQFGRIRKINAQAA